MKVQVSSSTTTAYLGKYWILGHNILRLNRDMVHLGRLIYFNFNSCFYFSSNNLLSHVPELLTYCVEGFGQVRHLLLPIPLQVAHVPSHTNVSVLKQRRR